MDAATGRLQYTGKAATKANPQSIAVDPQGRFAYAVNNSASSVSAYVIDAATGALTGVSTSPFTTDFSPQSVAVDPSGHIVYVVTASGVDAYTIDGTTGARKSVSGSPFAAGSSPVAINIDPKDRFAFVADFASGTNR